MFPGALAGTLAGVLAGILAGALAGEVLPGQTTTRISSPPGYLGLESEAGVAPYSMLLGGYREQRCQLADGNLRGNSVTLVRAELRRDTEPGFPCQGRSWSKVTLAVGATDIAGFTTSFAGNRIGPSSTVFAGPISWPAPEGLSTKPAPWGTPGLDFPFVAPVGYSGQRDLLLEYVFEGGALHDSQAWPAGTLHAYYLDGVSGANYAVSTSSHAGRTDCRDGNGSNGAVQRLYLVSHAAGSATHPNQFSHHQEAYNTAASAPVIQAIGIVGDPAGVPVGACNNLHIAPLATFPVLAGPDGYSSLTLGTAPYDPQFVGLSAWAQSAWADSVLGHLRLTNAARATIVAQPQELGWRNAVTTTTNEAAPLQVADGRCYGSTYVPLHRYTYR